MPEKRIIRTAWGIVAMAALLGNAVGCGPSGPKLHSVKGTVQLAGADVKILAGSHVEAALVSDPAVRTSGVIQANGSFKLGTLHAGSVLNGAREGTYQVRIVLADDDRQSLQQAASALAPRFLDFKTSGLQLDVPSRAGVTIELSPQ